MLTVTERGSGTENIGDIFDNSHHVPRTHFRWKVDISRPVYFTPLFMRYLVLIRYVVL